MPEQQKIDETIESITNKDKKKITKVEQSSTALEKEQNFDTEIEVDDQDSLLESDVVDLKESE